MEPNPRIRLSRPDAILLAIDHRGLPFRSDDNSRWPPFDHRAALDQVLSVCEAFQKHSGGTCLVQPLPAPPELLFGSLDAGLAGTLRASVARFNSLLAPEVIGR